MNEEERTGIVEKLTAKGFSCAKIAPIAKCSAGKVNIIQHRLGITRKHGASKAPESERPSRAELLACNGMTSLEICAKYRRGYYVISRWLDEYNIARVSYGCRAGALVDLNKVRALAESGQCAAQIAPQIEFSPSVVAKIARRAGIDLPVGDRQAHSRLRPSEEDFSREFGRHTPRVVASIFGVTEGAVSKWALHYGLRAAAPSRTSRRIMSASAASRPIAGSCSFRAIERAVANPSRAVDRAFAKAGAR